MTAVKELQRLHAQIRRTESGCWEWIGTILQSGYGYTRTPSVRKPKYTHRYMYELTCGPIPDGLVLDHLCRNRAPRRTRDGARNARQSISHRAAVRRYEARKKGQAA
jgi:hypothetical protein